jgi:chromosome segregation ATPase
LKKFKRLVELDAKMSTAVQTAESDPAELLKKDASIDDLAGKLRDAIGKNQISMDNKERQKTLQKIDSLLGAEPDKLKKEYGQTRKKLAELEQELASSGVLKEKEKVQTESSTLEKKLEDAQKRLRENKEELPNVQRRIASMKSQIESGVGKIESKEVTIKWT